MHEKAAEQKVKEAMDNELKEDKKPQPKVAPKKEIKKEVKEQKSPVKKPVVPSEKKHVAVPKKKPAAKKKKVVKKAAKKVVKEKSLDEEISQVYDEIHSDNSTDAASDDGGGFIGNHLKKVAEKKKAKEEAEKLAAERQYALDHPQEVGFMEFKKSVAKDPNHKKSILERVMEKEQTEAKEKAEYASQAKADFLSIMSHEIRTPLNGIIGTTNLLLESEPSQEQSKLLNALKFSGKTLMQIINDILDFSKIESGKIKLENEVFHLKELMDSVYSTFQLRAEQKGLELTFKCPAEMPKYLFGDSGKLIIVLNNLIGNAIKFTDSGSEKLWAASSILKKMK